MSSLLDVPKISNCRCGNGPSAGGARTNLTDTVVTRRDATLVTHGPYRYVRHPFYVSFALGVLANSLVAANWFFLLCGATAFVMLAVRTRIEEAKLVERFGDSYRDYMKRTGRFFPRFTDSDR